MSTRPGQPGARCAQEGSALLLMLTLLVMIVSVLLLEGWTAGRARAVVWQENAKRLGVVREALLAFAALQAGPAGSLPCPDQQWAGDGRSSDPCQAVEGMAMGEVPWRTLGLTPVRTGDGEAVWYAVSSRSLQTPARPQSAVAAWAGVEGEAAQWAAVLFVPALLPQPGAPRVLSALLHDALSLPITVAELAGVSGNDQHVAQ